MNKVGPLIKEARTKAGYTQQQLADQLDNVSANDISKAERGEKELTQAQLKAIAKATGVTQKSLIEAAASSTYGKETTGKKPSSSSSASSKPSSGSSGSGSSSSSSGTNMKLTATEKKLVELYRAADSDTKKEVMKLLKGEQSEGQELLSSLLGTAMEAFLNKK